MGDSSGFEPRWGIAVGAGSQLMEDRRKNYRAWDAQQGSAMPVAPCDALPEDDLVFFLLDLMPQVDLPAFHKYHAQEMRGQPPCDVTMMVTLLACACCVGVPSSRKIRRPTTRRKRTSPIRKQRS